MSVVADEAKAAAATSTHVASNSVAFVPTSGLKHFNRITRLAIPLLQHEPRCFAATDWCNVTRVQNQFLGPPPPRRSAAPDALAAAS